MGGHPLRAISKICLIVALLGLTLPMTTASASAAILHRRTELLALSGTLFSGPERVDVTGSIRVTVVTRSDPGGGGSADITSQLVNTTGIGQTGGGRYRFVGADHNTVAYPPDPVTPVAVFPTFLKIYPSGLVVPPNPIVPPNPVRPVRIRTAIAQDGSIDNITAEVFEVDENPNT